jgi:molybdenum cofactor synthesis domain-containing protein
MSTAAVVVIGNEVLSAKVVDENGPFLARELRALGVELRHMETVPDEVPVIADAVRRARTYGRWVFTSGGIGPTHDDGSVAAVAAALDRPVVCDERSLALLEKKFAARGVAMSPALRRLSLLPEGGQFVWDEERLFPVITLDDFVLLPGVPSLLRQGFGLLRERFRSAPIAARAVFLSLGEGKLAEHLDAVVGEFPDVSIGSYPRFDAADHRVKVTFDGRSAERVDAALRAFVARMPEGAVVRQE